MKRVGQDTLKYEITLVLLLLFSWETLGILKEIRTAIIYDWFIILAPLLWINLSIPFTYYLLRKILSSESNYYRVVHGGKLSYLIPDFRNLRELVRLRFFKMLWIGTSLAYFILYAYLQGMLVLSPSGDIEPRLMVVEGSIGYGPVLVFAPADFLGVVVRPYLASAALAISISSGLVITLSIIALFSSKRIAGVLPASFIGLAVCCPACLTTPTLAFLISLMTSLSLTTSFATASTFSNLLLISTTLLITSLTLTWIAISFLSKVPIIRGGTGR